MRSLSTVLLGLALVLRAAAQEKASEKAWKTLLQHQGVTFKYIYYRKADSQNDGVVLMLENSSDMAVTYTFTIVFWTENEELEANASGRLAPGERRTGDAAGLFWVPFRDGRSIGSIGLRSYKISPVNASSLEGLNRSRRPSISMPCP